MNKSAPFPRKGQIWEVVDGCDAQIQYLFSAPITFSGSGKLAAGERVCVMTEITDPQSAVVSFQPVRYDELHDSLVPRDMREMPRYKAYMLSVKTGYFHEHFRLIEDMGLSSGPLAEMASLRDIGFWSDLKRCFKEVIRDRRVQILLVIVAVLGVLLALFFPVLRNSAM